MNIKYLNHNTLTDIITFDYTEENVISGEIFISIDRVRENAKTFKVSHQQEFKRIIIHGLLHLCGYSDKTTDDKKVMTQKEDYYLNLF